MFGNTLGSCSFVSDMGMISVLFEIGFIVGLLAGIGIGVKILVS